MIAITDFLIEESRIWIEKNDSEIVMTNEKDPLQSKTESNKRL